MIKITSGWAGIQIVISTLGIVPERLKLGLEEVETRQRIETIQTTALL